MTTKQVRFNTIEIIELPICLGDHPSVHGGAPLTVAGKTQQRTTFKLDCFKAYRPDRRDRPGLIISPEAREDVILGHGFSLMEIVTTAWEIEDAKRPKRTTNKKVPSPKFGIKSLDTPSRQKKAVGRIKELNKSIYSLSKELRSGIRF